MCYRQNEVVTNSIFITVSFLQFDAAKIPTDTIQNKCVALLPFGINNRFWNGSKATFSSHCGSNYRSLLGKIV